MMRRLFLLILAISTTTASAASDWQRFSTINEELYRLGRSLSAAPSNSARSDRYAELMSEWATTASELDAHHYNLLVFSLLENYHASQLGQRDFFEKLIEELNTASKEMLAQTRADADWATTIPNALKYGLITFTIGKTAQLICLKTGCVEKTWNAVFRERAAELAKAKTPIGLLTYRPQAQPAGLLEYKQPEWKSLYAKAKPYLNIKSLSGQIVWSAVAGIAMSAANYGDANLLEQKLPPMQMLRLSQVHRACDLAQAQAEWSKVCETNQPTCSDRAAAVLAIGQIVAESAVLQNSFPVIANLNVEQFVSEEQDLLKRIPENHRKLFESIFSTNPTTRERLCKRLAVNQGATEEVMRPSGLLSSEKPKVD